MSGLVCHNRYNIQVHKASWPLSESTKAFHTVKNLKRPGRKPKVSARLAKELAWDATVNLRITTKEMLQGLSDKGIKTSRHNREHCVRQDSMDASHGRLHFSTQSEVIQRSSGWRSGILVVDTTVGWDEYGAFRAQRCCFYLAKERRSIQLKEHGAKRQTQEASCCGAVSQRVGPGASLKRVHHEEGVVHRDPGGEHPTVCWVTSTCARLNLPITTIPNILLRKWRKDLRTTKSSSLE